MVEVKQVDWDILSRTVHNADCKHFDEGALICNCDHALRAIATQRETYEARIAELEAQCADAEEKLIVSEFEKVNLTSANNDLLEALKAVHDDLLIRGKRDSDGVIVVEVGRGVWVKVCNALGEYNDKGTSDIQG